MECLTGIRSDAGQLVNLGILSADLQVDAEAAGREVARAQVRRLHQRPIANLGGISDPEIPVRGSSLSHPEVPVTP
jgi:hypothetical protein